VDADGMSLDDKRTELLPTENLGAVPKVALSASDHAKNNLPDILGRWRSILECGDSPLSSRASKSADKSAHSKNGKPSSELARPRTAQSFCVPKADIAAQGYDLSLNRYKEVVHEEGAHRTPRELLTSLANMEAEIQRGMRELEGMLK